MFIVVWYDFVVEIDLDLIELVNFFEGCCVGFGDGVWCDLWVWW